MNGQNTHVWVDRLGLAITAAFLELEGFDQGQGRGKRQDRDQRGGDGQAQPVDPYVGVLAVHDVVFPNRRNSFCAAA